MKLQHVLFCGLLAGGLALAQDAATVAKFNGTWQLQGGTTAAVWTLAGQPDSIHISRSEGDKKMTDFTCAFGKECEIKDAGQKVKVTLYFNGPNLVELETHGDTVIKRRFASSATDMMDLEVIPVSPAGKSETMHFKRVADSVASK